MDIHSHVFICIFVPGRDTVVMIMRTCIAVHVAVQEHSLWDVYKEFWCDASALNE